jgi:hypothetical protein
VTNPSQSTSYPPTQTGPVPAYAPAKPDMATIVGKVLCIAGILFGCLTAVLGLIPGIGLIAFAIAFPAIFFSGAGAVVLKVGQRGGAKLALVGIGLAILGIAIQIVELSLLSHVGAGSRHFP